jgi:hypothetical protein
MKPCHLWGLYGIAPYAFEAVIESVGMEVCMARASPKADLLAQNRTWGEEKQYPLCVVRSLDDVFKPSAIYAWVVELNNQGARADHDS